MNKKLAAAFATLMIALMAVGFAYAMWDKKLLIIGTVDTGEVDAVFTTAVSNDPGTTNDPGYTKHVGATEVSGAGTQTLTVTVANAYPCYSSRIDYTIDNVGTIPVKIQSITVTNPNPTEVTVTVTGIKVGDQIDKGASLPGDLEIHVEQAADELAEYTFSVEIYLVQWNEYT